MNFTKAISTLFESGSDLTSLSIGNETRSLLDRASMPLSAGINFAFSGGEPTAAGEYVSEQNALTISAVYACIRLIAESISTLPVKVYEVKSNTKREDQNHSLSYLLGCEPNPDMSATTFFECVVTGISLTGNGYIEIERGAKNNVVAFWPLNPLLTEPFRNPTGKIAFKTTADGTERIIDSKDMIHIPLFSLDGLKGISPVKQARQSLGLSQATLKQGSRFFSNGGYPSGILTPKASVPTTPEQAQQLKQAFEEMSTGLNQGRVAVLPSDWLYQQLGMSLEDSQFLESRAFSRNEIAAIWRVDPHYLGDSTRQSNSNHENAALSLLQETLAPYISKIEQEFNRKLLPPTGNVRSVYRIAFDYTERLRTDLKTTLDAISTARQWGVISANEGRNMIGLNPLGQEFDVLYSPVNMIDSKKFPDWLPTKGDSSSTARTAKRTRKNMNAEGN